MRVIRQDDRRSNPRAGFRFAPSGPGTNQARVWRRLGAVEDARAPEILTPLQSHYLVTGHHCLVATNSPTVLGAARNFFRLNADPKSSPSLTLRFWVDRDASGFSLRPQPVFRGLGHLAHARFGSEDSVLLDLRRGLAIGRFSSSMAGDLDYWQRVILPALVGLASDALGVTVIHSACVEREGEGLLLAGESGAGKSTLALALARIGFSFLSDDWTYLALAGGELSAWGLATPLKLLPESVRFFPELRDLTPGVALNGERSYEFDPEVVFGIRRSLRCQPRCLVFLDRHRKPGHTFIELPPEHAAQRLGSAQGRLPAELSGLRKIQRETIATLVGRECWMLRYGEDPETTAQFLGRFFSSRLRCARRSDPATDLPAFTRRGPDPTRRLTATGWAGDFSLKGHSIRLRTNSSSILRQVGRSLPALPTSQLPRQTFSWRLICEGDAARSWPLPELSSISADGLHLVNIGCNSFLAADAAARVGVGFLENKLVKDGRFEQVVLARLASMTKAARQWQSGPSTNVQNVFERPAKIKR